MTGPGGGAGAPARLALISVSDKRGLDRLGRGLGRLGWSLLSTGGTSAALRAAGCEVVGVGEHTGFPEILGGRVKTLHPRVFAGILAAPGPAHEAELRQHGIPAIGLVVVNLYPFRETASRAGVSLAEAVEQIDIGGPSLIRAAAKNHERVLVVVDPDDYDGVLEVLGMLDSRAGTAPEAGAGAEGLRRRLALKAFRHTAAYDAAISASLPGLIESADAVSDAVSDAASDAGGDGGRPPWSGRTARVAEALLASDEVALRYGENPHQLGLLARSARARGLAGARQLQGKALSYNNLGDSSGAWRLVWDLPGPGVAVIKHANPCGVGLGQSMREAFELARATDPLSAFGGVIAANRPVDRGFAEAVVEQFAEVVLAPGYDEGALEVLATKRNLRVLEVGEPARDDITIRSIDGGHLLQAADEGFDGEEREVVTARQPGEQEWQALELAWRVVKHVGSNAIVAGTARQVLGIGAGQMSRVDAAKIAVAKAREAGHDLAGSVAGSDAFFPFPDGIEALSEAGITAVIQPGGSIRDRSVIEACDRLGMAMVLSRRRHFRH